jgi:hypothetical protein
MFRSHLTRLSAAAVLLLAGCRDTTGPRDTTAPAPPRGVYSVTGDQAVHLTWLENTERDLVGYRVYEASCLNGANCPYDEVGATTATEYTLHGLSNGVTRYFAVTAFDRAGNESELSPEEVFDTPRPQGIGRQLSNYLQAPDGSGYDFSAATVRRFDEAATDVFFGANAGQSMMFTPFVDTDIQDAGYASSLDAIDYAPNAGWSPTGAVELIIGHCYVVWTHDDHYAKFRVTNLDSTSVQFDWAYQVAAGNRELRARRVRPDGTRIRRTIRWNS